MLKSKIQKHSEIISISFLCIVCNAHAQQEIINWRAIEKNVQDRFRGMNLPEEWAIPTIIVRKLELLRLLKEQLTEVQRTQLLTMAKDLAGLPTEPDENVVITQLKTSVVIDIKEKFLTASLNLENLNRLRVLDEIWPGLGVSSLVNPPKPLAKVEIYKYQEELFEILNKSRGEINYLYKVRVQALIRNGVPIEVLDKNVVLNEVPNHYRSILEQQLTTADDRKLRARLLKLGLNYYGLRKSIQSSGGPIKSEDLLSALSNVNNKDQFMVVAPQVQLNLNEPLIGSTLFNLLNASTDNDLTFEILFLVASSPCNLMEKFFLHSLTIDKVTERSSAVEVMRLWGEKTERHFYPVISTIFQKCMFEDVDEAICALVTDGISIGKRLDKKEVDELVFILVSRLKAAREEIEMMRLLEVAVRRSYPTGKLGPCVLELTEGHWSQKVMNGLWEIIGRIGVYEPMILAQGLQRVKNEKERAMLLSGICAGPSVPLETIEIVRSVVDKIDEPSIRGRVIRFLKMQERFYAAERLSSDRDPTLPNNPVGLIMEQLKIRKSLTVEEADELKEEIRKIVRQGKAKRERGNISESDNAKLNEILDLCKKAEDQINSLVQVK